jgi:hypothetical protein
MLHKLKALGLAVVAVLALNAMAAASASATDLFTSDAPSEETTITGTQTGAQPHKFTVLGQPIECSEAHFMGKVVGNSVESVTVSPSYSGCTYGSNPATVNMRDCDYNFTSETNESGHNVVHIEECPTGAPITVEIVVGGTNCKLTIITQTPGQGVTFTNDTSGETKDLLVKATAKVKIHKAEGNFTCSLLGGTTPLYTGDTTVVGIDQDSSDPVNLTVHTAADVS